MKRLFMLAAAFVCFVFLLPVILLSGEAAPEAPPPGVIEVGGASQPDGSPSPQAVFPGDIGPEAGENKTQNSADSLQIRVKTAEGVSEMPLSDYLPRAVAGEMPSSFPFEALKAQATAARTLVMYNRNSASPRHTEADICTSPSCCMAFSEAEVPENIKNAVLATDGVLILYENAPILAVFHAASSGRTESAADVWGGDVPYLKAVESPGEDAVPSAAASKTFTETDLRAALLRLDETLDLSGGAQGWFGKTERSQSGGVVSLEVGRQKFSGERVRAALSLNSANFSFDFAEDNFTVTVSTLGHGHGVGMSQYGARALALEGKNYADILRHYYYNVQVGIAN